MCKERKGYTAEFLVVRELPKWGGNNGAKLQDSDLLLVSGSSGRSHSGGVIS